MLPDPQNGERPSQQQCALEDHHCGTDQAHALVDHLAHHLPAARRALPRAQRPLARPQPRAPVGRHYRMRAACHGVLVDARPGAEDARHKVQPTAAACMRFTKTARIDIYSFIVVYIPVD